MDAAIALSVVPVIVGLVVLAPRLGLPSIYETPADSRATRRADGDRRRSCATR